MRDYERRCKSGRGNLAPTKCNVRGAINCATTNAVFDNEKLLFRNGISYQLLLYLIGDGLGRGSGDGNNIYPISFMCVSGFLVFCLNQDFQDYRICRIREEGLEYTCMDVYVWTSVAPLGLLLFQCTCCYTPVAAMGLREDGRGDPAPTSGLGAGGEITHDECNVRGAMNCATTNEDVSLIFGCSFGKVIVYFLKQYL